MNDLTYRDEGTVVLFTIHSPAAQAWVEENVSLESWQWLGTHAFAVDRRFASGLLEGMREEGLIVEEVR